MCVVRGGVSVGLGICSSHESVQFEAMFQLSEDVRCRRVVVESISIDHFHGCVSCESFIGEEVVLEGVVDNGGHDVEWHHHLEFGLFLGFMLLLSVV